ncbi:UV-stimulated scaffold protein A-like [Hippocampus zosterae]|uniref:UV-stimulated scaffold protein A-like n=1 Tax=Hippocampus zosterae TaxID=109293 RepID=UPI00223D1720|nr:UV-stimulated scaffold protein A-like [Hippocampus zosterae]XP_051933522.1 UV-stimulated scaffold protein A-like [Hippocampus zosterae]
MELSQRDRLSELVEELTTSGQLQIDKEKIREVKKICKESNDYIDHVYHSLMSQLNQDHAEIRLSAFQTTSELFPKSHHFRTLLVDNFQEFLELTLETNIERPLPPPQQVARKLRSLAIQTIQSWQSSYGSAYKKLELGYYFLKQFKKVDFQDAEARTVAERERETERQRKMERIYSKRLKAAMRDLEDSSPDIEVALTELDSCLKLLYHEFPLQDNLTTNTCPLTQPTTGCVSDDEQPCSSKNLMNDRTRKMQESKENVNVNREEWEEKKTKKKKHKRSENEELNRSDKQNKGEMEGEQRYRMKHEDKTRCDVEEEDPLHGDSFIRNSGLISRSYCLDLNLGSGLHVEETEDNEAVVSTLLDLQRLLSTKHLPAVRRWVQVFTKSGANQHLLSRALYLKSSLEASLLKLTKLNIDSQNRVNKTASSVEEDDDDDSDFIEVPEKEGYESDISGHLQVEDGLGPTSSTPAPSQHVLKSIVTGTSSTRPQAPSAYYRRLTRLKDEEKDPTCAAATFHIFQKKRTMTASSSSTSEPSSTQSNKDQTTSQAPVVPFGLDLYYWGQEQPNSGKITKSASQHQFWVPVDVEEEVENKELKAESRCRYISFPGQFTPVSHYCNAPLGNGKMCKRQDRLKCPFHGCIVPRDQEGRPCSQEDHQREEQHRTKTKKKHDWHDAGLVRDIEIATGQNLGSERLDKRRRRKKNKYPNLSNLKDSGNTSRARLEKRIFNKSAMRRVAETMNKVDRKKHEKFSNQFNYALN